MPEHLSLEKRLECRKATIKFIDELVEIIPAKYQNDRAYVLATLLTTLTNVCLEKFDFDIIDCIKRVGGK